MFGWWFNTPSGAVMAQADSAEAKAKEAIFETSSAQARIDRLVLINRAMWEILKERFSVSEEVLKAKALEIDLRDGRQDSKLRLQVRTCEGCGQILSSGRLTCLHCSAPISGSPFDGV